MMRASAAPEVTDRWRILAPFIAPLRRLRQRHGGANIVLAAVIVVPLLANALLLAGYLNAANERAWLTRQVQEAQHSIDELAKGGDSAAAATAVPGGVITLPRNVESADMMDLLLKLAQDSAVEVVAVNEQGVTNQRLGDKDYLAHKYNVQVRARVSQLVAFLNRLEQTPQGVLSVSNLSGSPKGGQNWLISFDLIAYASPKSAFAPVPKSS